MRYASCRNRSTFPSMTRKYFSETTGKTVNQSTNIFYFE